MQTALSNNVAIIFSSLDDGKFFRSTSHTQRYESKVQIPDRYVPITYSLPHEAVARDSLSDGVVKNINDIISIYHYDQGEVRNPDQLFQPS